MENLLDFQSVQFARQSEFIEQDGFWFGFLFNIPSQQFFSHFGMEPPLPGNLQVLWEP